MPGAREVGNRKAHEPSMVVVEAEPQQTNMQAWRRTSSLFVSTPPLPAALALHLYLAATLVSADRIVSICSGNYQTVVDSKIVITVAAANSADQDDKRTRSVAPSRLEHGTVDCYCGPHLAIQTLIWEARGLNASLSPPYSPGGGAFRHQFWANH